MPYLDTRPWKGLESSNAAEAAGCRIEPPVSVPSRLRPSPPPLQQQSRQRSHRAPAHDPRDCRLTRKVLVRRPMANSSMLVLPTLIIPRCHVANNRRIIVRRSCSASSIPLWSKPWVQNIFVGKRQPSRAFAASSTLIISLCRSR